MKKIGYTNDSYPERRNIIEGNLHSLKKIKSLNTYYPQTAIKKVPYLGKNVDTFFKEMIFYTDGIDGVHLFNSVTDKDIPWISTFETYIPRTTATLFLENSFSDSRVKKSKRKIERYLKLIANENCKKVISLSEQNFKMQQRLLKEFPKYKSSIEEKMLHLSPPQKKLMERKDIEEKNTNSILRFLFVGKDFTRKGGKEIVDVFSKIREETNLDFELTLVSLGKSFNYAFGQYQDTEEELQETKRKIESAEWIKLYESVENKELLEMMARSDVGLLPTWADTYGYSVLEFQASGCPVITTNVRALPEINNQEVGWMVNLPIDEYGKVIITSNADKLRLRNKLQENLMSVILNILQHPERIKEKSLKAYDQVTKNHSVENYMEELSQIYVNHF